MLAIIPLFCLFLLLIVSPPNNWDSMTYHMSRVAHWIQNHSVAHYPTYNLPQLFHPPFNSFTIMHLQILSGRDTFANLVQWWAMIGSIIGTSLIAKQLGAKERGQILAAVFCATLPLGILKEKKETIDEELQHSGLFYLFAIRPLPILPDGIMNFAMGQTSLKFRDY